MTSPKTRGRMLNKDLSDSKGFAKLSPPAAVLFCMVIPHLSPHGKMNGDPGYIKGEVCPRIPYLTIENIPSLLLEISTHTNMKWFTAEERYWVHSTKFLSEHQNLDPNRMGKDRLPSYSGVIPELHTREGEGEGEGIRGSMKHTFCAVPNKASDPAPDNGTWPDALEREKEVMESLEVFHTDLHDPKFWRSINEWIASTTYPVYTLDELRNYIAWHRSQSKSRQHKNLKRGFRNWLTTKVRWEERDAQRKAAGRDGKTWR